MGCHYAGHALPGSGPKPAPPSALDSTCPQTPRGGGCGLPGAYLGNAVGFGDGEGRVSKSVLDEESSGMCFQGPIRTSRGSKQLILAPGV